MKHQRCARHHLPVSNSHSPRFLPEMISVSFMPCSYVGSTPRRESLPSSQNDKNPYTSQPKRTAIWSIGDVPFIIYRIVVRLVYYQKWYPPVSCQPRCSKLIKKRTHCKIKHGGCARHHLSNSHCRCHFHVRSQTLISTIFNSAALLEVSPTYNQPRATPAH